MKQLAGVASLFLGFWWFDGFWAPVLFIFVGFYLIFGDD